MYHNYRQGWYLRREKFGPTWVSHGWELKETGQKTATWTFEKVQDTIWWTLGEVVGTEHAIELTADAKIVRKLKFWTEPCQREVVTEQIKKMLKHGIIEPENTPWVTPVVVAPKKDGSYRLCVDFSRLSLISILDYCTFTHMDEWIDTLVDAKYLSELDWNLEYWKIPTKEVWQRQGYIRVTFRLLQNQSDEFWVKQIPENFQRELYIVIAGYKWQIWLVYLDDIIAFSKDL